MLDHPEISPTQAAQQPTPAPLPTEASALPQIPEKSEKSTATPDTFFPLLMVPFFAALISWVSDLLSEHSKQLEEKDQHINRLEQKCNALSEQLNALDPREQGQMEQANALRPREQAQTQQENPLRPREQPQMEQQNPLQSRQMANPDAMVRTDSPQTQAPQPTNGQGIVIGGERVVGAVLKPVPPKEPLTLSQIIGKVDNLTNRIANSDMMMTALKNKDPDAQDIMKDLQYLVTDIVKSPYPDISDRIQLANIQNTIDNITPAYDLNERRSLPPPASLEEAIEREMKGTISAIEKRSPKNIEPKILEKMADELKAEGAVLDGDSNLATRIREGYLYTTGQGYDITRDYGEDDFNEQLRNAVKTAVTEQWALDHPHESHVMETSRDMHIGPSMTPDGYQLPVAADLTPATQSVAGNPSLANEKSQMSGVDTMMKEVKSTSTSAIPSATRTLDHDQGASMA